MVLWATAKKFASAADIERFACIGWTVLNAKGVTEAHWQVVGTQVKGVKLESFKRQIWVISKKAKEDGPDTDASEEADVTNAGKTKAAKGGKGGNKRKAAAVDDADDQEIVNGDDGERKKKGAKRAKKGKKAGDEKFAVHDDGDAANALIKKEAADDLLDL